MSFRFTRRQFVANSAATGLGAAGILMSPALMKAARAKEPLTVVEWGSPYVEASKVIAEKQSAVDITWVLHAGGSAAILPKIKTSWPNPPYDLIAAWKPVWISMSKEDWIQPVTLGDVPNLKDIPESYITKDEAGNWLDVPRTLSGIFWCYRNDTCPIKITKMEDLLDPKLKGQISWPATSANTNLQVVSLAIARGGDEYNMEPGWEFLKELAESGNIGRVHATPADAINALTSGEISVMFNDLPTIGAAAQNVPITYLTKTDESLKIFPWIESWGVLKSSKNKKAAFDYINFSINPENNALFNEGILAGPTNTKADPSDALKPISYSADEVEKYTYFVDYGELSEQLDASIKRFETEVQPLLSR